MSAFAINSIAHVTRLVGVEGRFILKLMFVFLLSAEDAWALDGRCSANSYTASDFAGSLFWGLVAGGVLGGVLAIFPNTSQGKWWTFLLSLAVVVPFSISAGRSLATLCF